MNYKIKITGTVGGVSKVVELETDDKTFAQSFVENLNSQDVQPQIDVVSVPTEIMGNKEKLDKLIDDLIRNQQEKTKTDKNQYRVYPEWPVYPEVQDWFQEYTLKPPFHVTAGNDKW